MTGPKVTAIILTVGDAAAVADCVRSLDAAAFPGPDIIIVRNAPREQGFEEAVRALSGKISGVAVSGFNSGYSAGNNLGLRAALEKGADYILLLNDDTVVAPDFLEKLLAETEKRPEAGMAGPRILYFSERNRIWFSGAKFDGETCAFAFPGADRTEEEYGHDEPEEADFITGCALLVKREVIEKIGPLDERFFLYWEDSDWGLRAKAAGFKCVVVPSSKIWHKVSGSSGGADSPFKAYHKTFSHLLFCGIHAPAAKGKLLRGLARDIAWLLLKARGQKRFRKAWAYALAVFDHYTRAKARAKPWLL